MKKMMILVMTLVMLATAASALAEDDITVAQPVETLSDYTARALPITEDTYNEVVNNVLDQIGVTYFVKGTVAEIRDDFLPRVLIYAGEDGESLPVYIEIPATSSYLPQPGDNLRVYGEVLQLLNGKPLLNGRYVFQEEEEAEPAPAVGTDSETGLTVEEYSAKAWPITEEEYDELVLNPENRLGQVYVVKGPVDSILEDGLQKVIICAGEDGRSLPVIVTVPATSSLLLEAGAQVRIYGEAAAPENGMPLVEGRYVYLFDEETEYE